MLRITNVPIRDLLILLSQIADECELIEFIIDPDEKKFVINPVYPEDPADEPEEELTEDNIYDII